MKMAEELHEMEKCFTIILTPLCVVQIQVKYMSDCTRCAYTCAHLYDTV